ncbi:MAG: metallophosphoesterase, partial [Nocardioides sp.]
MRSPRTVAVALLLWLGLTCLVFSFLFFNASRNILLAGHEASLSPTWSRTVVLQTGPLLPDVRFSSGAPIGVAITLGGTEASSSGTQMERYAVLASHPQGQIETVKKELFDLAWEALLRSLAAAAIPAGGLLLLGARRRAELASKTASVGGVATLCVFALIVAGLWQPWRQPQPEVSEARNWRPLADFLGDQVAIPESLRRVELSDDPTAQQSARLLTSALDTYRQSDERYGSAAAEVKKLKFHQPAADETVAILLTDRHDNVGMDQVHRAVADAAGATVVMTGGDDTSTGSKWEAFSLDSLDAAFSGYEKYGVAGNHDFGGFVPQRLADDGWTMLDLKVIDGPGGSAILGVDDPRSSGLGAWRESMSVSFAEVEHKVAEVACGSERRVATLLVHDSNLGREALARGCADLVVGGHVHV